MAQLYRSNFVFQTNSFEVREAGKCLVQDRCDAEIVVEVSGKLVRVELDGIGDIPMNEVCEFECLGAETDVLPDRVQYLNRVESEDENMPVVCQVLFRDNTVSSVRFAMAYPDRVIEFRGDIVALGQPSREEKKRVAQPAILADEIVRELQHDNSLNVETLMEAGAKIYSQFSAVELKEAAATLVESLKLFVMANKLDKQISGNRSSMYRPKILMFISLCNYKLGNDVIAYCAAKQGLEVLKQVAQNSVIKFPSTLLGKDTMIEVLTTLERDGFNEGEFRFTFNAVDVNVIDTEKVDTMLNAAEDTSTKRGVVRPSDQEFLLALIKSLDTIRNRLMKLVFEENDRMALMSVYVLHEVACSVFFAWEFYGYGYITDFWKEEAVVETYEKFKKDVLGNLTKQRITFKTKVFPLESLDKEGVIKKHMLELLDTLLKDIARG